MVAPRQRIASAFSVVCGRYGDVTRYARERGVCRQWVYRESAWVVATLEGEAVRQERDALRQSVEELESQNVELQRRLAVSVELDPDRQAEFACVGQASGVTLGQLHGLLEVLLRDKAPSVAKLGRMTKAAGEKSGELLKVLDAFSAKQIKQALGDEIYVNKPVLMVVEPESLCWQSGRLVEHATGEEWHKEFASLPHLEQVTRDAGSALGKGVELLNKERKSRGQSEAADQLEHWHTLREAGRGLSRYQSRAKGALRRAEEAQKKVGRLSRDGRPLNGAAQAAHHRWRKAERTMDAWQEVERVVKRIDQALQLVTPDGELNTRQRAEAVLAEALPQLPEEDFAKFKRLLRQPKTLTYLDEVQRKLDDLPVPRKVRQAAVRSECLRRRPQVLRDDSKAAAVRRGILFVCGVILSKAGEAGEIVAQAVRNIFRNTWRASSLVEGINSVVRMHQAQHRKLTQPMLDLKRLYWNCRRFRTGRRRRKSPYEWLGIPWPPDLRWWDLLKMTPEQVRYKLSTVEMAV